MKTTHAYTIDSFAAALRAVSDVAHVVTFDPFARRFEAVLSDLGKPVNFDLSYDQRFLNLLANQATGEATNESDFLTLRDWVKKIGPSIYSTEEPDEAEEPNYLVLHPDEAAQMIELDNGPIRFYAVDSDASGSGCNYTAHGVNTDTGELVRFRVAGYVEIGCYTFERAQYGKPSSFDLSFVWRVIDGRLRLQYRLRGEDYSRAEAWRQLVVNVEQETGEKVLIALGAESL